MSFSYLIQIICRKVNDLKCNLKCFYLIPMILKNYTVAQSAGSLEYTDCISTEG